MRKRLVFLFLLGGLMGAGAAQGVNWRELGGGWLRSVYRWAMLPEADSTRSHETPWEGEEPLTAEARIITPGPLVAGSYTTLTVIYRAGRGGLQPGGGVRVAFEHGADWGPLQTSSPRGENFVSLKGPSGVKWDLKAKYLLGRWGVVEARVRGGVVREGEEIQLILGDKSGGSPGLRVTTVSEVPGAGRVRIFEDRSGSGHFHLVSGVPELMILPGLPHHLRVLARSWAELNQPVKAVIHMDDEYNNIVTSYRGWFSVSDAATGRRLGEARITPEGGGLGVVKGALCRQEGILRLHVEAVGGGYSAVSNPIRCLRSSEEMRTFFGSIHNHTLVTDGLNTPEGAATYARDASNLDFFALTEHAGWPDWEYDPVLLRHSLDEASWKHLQEVIRQFHREGEFVTLFGVEWTTTTYGDKCIYFFDDRARFRVFPGDPAGLYRSLRGERVVVITHPMTAISGIRGPRWDLVDSRYEKVMEIASFQGVREYGGNAYPICEADSLIPVFVSGDNMAAGALARGLKLGFVAGSDDHSGKPGAGNKGVLRCPIDGLTAVRGRRLDRETIFSALEKRAVYATTGARILLDFSINGEPMGGELVLAEDQARVIRAEVYGEAPVAEVAVIRDNPAKPLQIWTFTPAALDPGELSWADTSPLNAPAYYYLRIRQIDNHMAWSSPIWVERITPP